MHVAQLTKDDRARRLKSSLDKGDRVKPHPSDPRAMMISSESHAGLFHYSRADYCDCVGFTQHGMCRHAVRASYELWHLKRRTEQPDIRHDAV